MELRSRQENLVEQQVYQDQMQTEVKGKVLWAIWSAPPCWEASL